MKDAMLQAGSGAGGVSAPLSVGALRAPGTGCSPLLAYMGTPWGCRVAQLCGSDAFLLWMSSLSS